MMQSGDAVSLHAGMIMKWEPKRDNDSLEYEDDVSNLGSHLGQYQMRY